MIENSIEHVWAATACKESAQPQGVAEVPYHGRLTYASEQLSRLSRCLFLNLVVAFGGY